MARLSGNRRRPFIVKKVAGWNEKGQSIYSIIGYADTREAGNMLLAEYNRDPWDVDRAKLTLWQLFDLWKEKKAPKLGKSNQESLRAAFFLIPSRHLLDDEGSAAVATQPGHGAVAIRVSQKTCPFRKLLQNSKGR